MSLDQKEITKRTKKERVTLTKETHSRLVEWSKQLGERDAATKVNFSQLVEWAVLAHPSILTTKDLNEIHSRYWNELSFAYWAVKRLKEAKENGEKISLTDLLRKKQPEMAAKRVPKASGKSKPPLEIQDTHEPHVKLKGEVCHGASNL